MTKEEREEVSDEKLPALDYDAGAPRPRGDNVKEAIVVAGIAIGLILILILYALWEASLYYP